MPFRGNLVDDCVRVMNLRIAAGEWSTVLPGERRLAETLQVGRDTVRLALRQLEREGVLTASALGSARKIARLPDGISAVQGRSLVIGLLSHRPLEQLPQPILREIGRIREALAAKGGTMEVFAPAWYDQRKPDRRLEALIASGHCAAWLLLRSSAAVQEFFVKRQIPALIRGYPHPGIDLPHLDVDWHATARHAAGQLWRKGHRRVVVLIPAEPLKGVEAAVRGVGDLGEAGFEATVLVEDGTSAGLGRMLARALNFREKPTAIIATRPRQAATALTWLASQGVRVPQDMGLISLAWEPFLDHLVPEISSYRSYPEAVAKLVLRRIERLVAGDPHPGGNTWIAAEVIKGASVAKIG
jgi:DNA-binding LacI/PurR family transcriptional regulator